VLAMDGVASISHGFLDSVPYTCNLLNDAPVDRKDVSSLSFILTTHDAVSLPVTDSEWMWEVSEYHGNVYLILIL